MRRPAHRPREKLLNVAFVDRNPYNQLVDGGRKVGRVCGRGWGVCGADRTSAAMKDQGLLDWQKGAIYRALLFRRGASQGAANLGRAFL